ncbi:uncharacterized protein LOC34619169 [Cyclospora cayetanensis]|uniref:Uncharacterized protein LOC34619169 n=1 Tax=Cyclospora cayetanensis TaxID=88456 RepID=A0A6P6RWI0_9EIME|nr:uncharacterized protein LOC34619169 [Cyclospora cayetanensis]
MLPMKPASVADAPSEETEPGTRPLPETPARGRPGEKFRDEYKPSAFLVDNMDLHFVLDPSITIVTGTMLMRRAERVPSSDLLLDGENLELLSLRVNGEEIAEVDSHEGEEEQANARRGYHLLKDGSLVISKSVLPAKAGERFEVKTRVLIHPNLNLKLSGLYVSGDALVTQCEAEGFRRITFSLDRPDVQAKYKVRLEADRTKYPVLLSNGNKIDEGSLSGDSNRHFVLFEDPHPKPSYLFAILAGPFASVTDTFTTKSGNEVALAVYSEPGQLSKLSWAMESVKLSMKWDEETYDREYDLDEFNVACVSEFNAGAMENKGLNIFNCSMLLADIKTATDRDFERVLAVIGHEYFHNWTGDRVTVRDWFQLTLKEGLTVFREQSFMASIMSAAVQRIQYVENLISKQFVEDAGPMAHPIQPESYMAVDNFYTSTVYDKGAEVVRMYQTLLGPAGFKKGMDLYFERNDGHAATCEDFRAAMADANDVDLSQFELWYSQAGTPHLEVTHARYNAEDQVFEIGFRQHTPPTPGQETKRPQVIPIKLGLIGKESKRDLLQPTMVLELTENEQKFRIGGINEDCLPSILRNFSAPVKLIYPQQTFAEKAFLLAYDTDPVTKWMAARALATPIILSRTRQALTDEAADKFEELPEDYIKALRMILQDQATDHALKAMMLQLPDWSSLAAELKPLDPEALYRALRSVRMDLYNVLHEDMLALYTQLTIPENQEDGVSPKEFSRRKLRNSLLLLLSEPRNQLASERAFQHFTSARCMSDKYSALLALASMPTAERETAFSRFFDEAHGDALVLDKWFKAQALSDLPDEVERVSALLRHPSFSYTKPNRFRSLVLTFANFNYRHFHRLDGKGYELLADVILTVDKFNPLAAARGAKLFLQWRKLGPERQELVANQLKRILGEQGLSDNVREIVAKALEQPPATSSEGTKNNYTITDNEEIYDAEVDDQITRSESAEDYVPDEPAVFSSEAFDFLEESEFLYDGSTGYADPYSVPEE